MFDKLIDSGAWSRITFVIFFIILLTLYILEVDIIMLSNMTYTTVLLLIIVLIISITSTLFFIYRIDQLNTKVNRFLYTDNIDEKIKNSVDLIESQIMRLLDNQAQILTSCKIILEEISGIPNLKALMLLFSLKISETEYKIFKECLSYTLTSNPEHYQNISLENLNTAITNIKQDFIRFLRKNLRKSVVNESISDKINEKIDSDIQIILEELQKEKKIHEKLYIISTILRNAQQETREIVNEYLVNIQTDMFK